MPKRKLAEDLTHRDVIDKVIDRVNEFQISVVKSIASLEATQKGMGREVGEMKVAIKGIDTKYESFLTDTRHRMDDLHEKLDEHEDNVRDHDTASKTDEKWRKNLVAFSKATGPSVIAGLTVLAVLAFPNLG